MNENHTLMDILATVEPQRVATGFTFTEGPLWHPDGYFYFVDHRESKLYRITLGQTPELVRTTSSGNGTTFDLQGRLLVCEDTMRAITRTTHDGKVEVLVDRYQGGRFNRPNDIVCHSDGSIYFTDPSMRVPFNKREIPSERTAGRLWHGANVYRVAPDGEVSVVADCEYPNGLAFSPDERTLYVANSRSSKYIHAIEVDAGGEMVRRRIFADLNGDEPGGPDGIKVDTLGRVYCTGPGGIWVLTPEGKRVGVIRFPELPINFAFGGPDLKTLFCCAHTSLYTLEMKVPGQPHPWYLVRAGGSKR